jgi:hypothetical protein
VVKQVFDNATYLLPKLDGMELKVLVVGKKIGLFQGCRTNYAIKDFKDAQAKTKDLGSLDEDNLKECTWPPSFLVPTSAY